MTIVCQTPELLYAETTARSTACRAVAETRAAEGDVVASVAATWAADVATVQAVLWERVMLASPDPDQQLADIAAAVGRALGGFAQEPQHATTAADAVRAARRGLSGAFDDAARSLIERRLPVLGHLEELPAPTSAEVADVAAQRLGGSSLDEVVAERSAEARACMAEVRALVAEGRSEQALALAWQADWATLEAYLLDAARAVGDDTLLSVDLRWSLAVRATDAITALPPDLGRAVALIRQHLVESLGAVEGERLRWRFEPLPLADLPV